MPREICAGHNKCATFNVDIFEQLFVRRVLHPMYVVFVLTPTRSTTSSPLFGCQRLRLSAIPA